MYRFSTDTVGPGTMANLARVHPRVLAAAAAALLVCLPIAPAVVLADDPRLEDITPESLALSGSVGDEAVTASLRFESSQALQLNFLSSPLVADGATDDAEGQCAADPLCIDPSKVTFEPKSLELEPFVPLDVVLSVSGFTRPGTYAGSITVLSRRVPEATPAASPALPEPSPSPEPPASSEVPISLAISAGNALVVVGGAEALDIKQVPTDWPPDAVLAWLFLSEAERSQNLHIPLLNPTQDVLNIDGTISVFGTGTGEELPASALVSPEGSLALQPGSAGRLSFPLALADVPADTYAGGLHLTVSPDHPPQELPLRLTVRNGPFWPLMFIIGGIVLGVVAKWWLDRGVKVADAHDRFQAVVRKLASADLTAGDHAVLRERLATIEAALRGLDHAGSDAQVTELSTAIGVLASLKEFEATADAKYEAEIRNVRALARFEQAAEAAKALTAVRVKAYVEASRTVSADDLRELDLRQIDEGVFPHAARPSRRMGWIRWVGSTAVMVFVVLLVAVGVLVISNLGNFAAAPPIPLEWVITVGVLLAVVVVAIAALRRGSPVRPYVDAFGAFMARHRVTVIGAARWPLRLALLVLLTVVGMELLYVNEASDLLGSRADPMVHYVFWGLGTDITSRTLTNFAKG
jgi:hypothetical protein